MDSRDIAKGLFETMRTMPVIDAHEHLPPESDRISAQVDFSTLFSHYTQTDLKAAGMSNESYLRFQSDTTGVDEKWKLFHPYWEKIRFMSYARPALIAAREFYGCDDINAETYRLLSERMQAANKPGLYKFILRDKCHISLVLTQIGRIPETDRDLLVPLLPMSLFHLKGPEETLQRGENAGIQVKSLDDYLEAMRRGLQEWKAKGVVGMKMCCSDFLEEVPRDTAEREFLKLMSGKAADLTSLNFFIHNEMLTMAGKLNLVVAVHCGIIWNNWNDFYATHPRYMIPLLLRHQKTKFDLYHAGIPWVREMGVIGKDFPNAHLNLCWCHIISPRMTVSLLDEWMDLVPLNKITGFGGDYRRPVEKIYGHLMMAKQNIARVLAGRVSDGLMSEKEALRVAQQFLFENPKELYQLDGKKL